MTDAQAPCILVVDADILVRQPLAQYLRECGFLVLEAVDAVEAREFLDKGGVRVGIVLIDAGDDRGQGFAFASWIRANHPGIEVMLAGTITRAVEKAGDLCEEGPAVNKPYEHHLVLERIRQLVAARQRSSD